MYCGRGHLKVVSSCGLTVLYLPGSKQQTDSVRDELGNIEEHLAAKESDMSHKSWWRGKL